MTYGFVPSASIVTSQALRLDFNIEPGTWEDAFDSLEIFRSRMTQNGPWEPLTGSTWRGARLPRGTEDVTEPLQPQVAPSANINLKTLSARIDRQIDLTITFVGINPMSLDLAAFEVTSQGRGLIRAFIHEGRLVLESTRPGAAAVLQVTGGTAAAFLGFSIEEPESVAFGLDARLSLIPGVSAYSFIDPHGDASFFYRTRFFSSVSRLYSDYSLPFQQGSPAGLSSEQLVTGFVRLVDPNGAPVVNRSVLIYHRFSGKQVDGRSIVGEPVSRKTNENGEASFTFVRGSRISVALPGTNLVRDITVPTDPSILSFNLFDAAFGTNDVFTVQRPALEYATRRSL